MEIKRYFIIQAFSKYCALLGKIFRAEREWKTDYGQERIGCIWSKNRVNNYRKRIHYEEVLYRCFLGSYLNWGYKDISNRINCMHVSKNCLRAKCVVRNELGAGLWGFSEKSWLHLCHYIVKYIRIRLKYCWSFVLVITNCWLLFLKESKFLALITRIIYIIWYWLSSYIRSILRILVRRIVRGENWMLRRN